MAYNGRAERSFEIPNVSKFVENVAKPSPFSFFLFMTQNPIVIPLQTEKSEQFKGALNFTEWLYLSFLRRWRPFFPLSLREAT